MKHQLRFFAIIPLILLIMVLCSCDLSDLLPNASTTEINTTSAVISSDNQTETDDSSSESESTNKQVPIYQGMTISDSLDDAINTSFSTSSDFWQKYAVGFVLNEDANIDVPDSDNPDNDFEENIDDVVLPTIIVENTNSADYYSELNQDIYITIHINNPSNFVILRFTLNGTVYQSYQFQDGSDSENLILKVNTGSNSGVVEYTIDSIKYIDDTDNGTKDVNMTEGDQTVKVGILYDEIPESIVSDIEIGTTTFSASVYISDIYDLINYDNNKINFYLYDGENIVETISLSKGSNQILIDNLEMGKKYQYAVISVYDILDGNGEEKAVMNESDFTTPNAYQLSNVDSTQTSVSFECAKTGDIGTIVSVILFKDGKAIQEITDNSLSFTGLLSNNEYEIRLYYSYTINGEIHTFYDSESVTTIAKTAPVVSLSISNETQTGFSYTISSTDPDGIIVLGDLTLVHGEDEPVGESLSASEITGLLSNNAYTLKLAYNYDLNDGEGVHTAYASDNCATLAQKITATSIEVLNEDSPKVGEEVLVRIYLNNPDSIAIDSFEINEIETKIVGGNQITTVLLTFIPETDGGEYVISLSSIKYTTNNCVLQQIVSSECTCTIAILGSIEVTSIKTENGSDFIYANDPDELIIKLNNPTGYVILGLVLTYNGTDVEYDSVTTIDDNHIKVAWAGSTNVSKDSIVQKIIVKSITYDINESGSGNSESVSNTIMTYVYLIKSDEIKDISTASELQNMENGYIYSIKNDIDFKDLNWNPYDFYGIILGNGYSFTNFSCTAINSSTEIQYYGLFQKFYGYLENINFASGYISINTDGQVYCGFVAGYFSGGCSDIATIDGTCTINVQTESNSYIGGLIGFLNYSAIISNCYNTGKITGTEYIGGIAGYVTETYSIFNCYNTGNINGTYNVGGIVGYAAYTALIISNCYNIGNIISNTVCAGGIAGTIEANSSIFNCYNIGNVSGSEHVGGIVGDVDYSSSVYNCYNIGNVSGSGSAGGIAGSIYHTSSISNSYNTGNITGSSITGGISGYTNSSSISNCYVLTTSEYNDSNSYSICTENDLNSSSFYISTLGWSEEIWDFSNLNFNNNLFPNLK